MDSSICVAIITGLPAIRQARTKSFCAPGTSSGGISTPKSPRATMIASASRTSSSIEARADGFSIFAKTPARPPTSPWASIKSAGRCTKENATQSTPSSRPNAKSSRSFSVMGDRSSTVSGRLTPLRSVTGPPLITRASMAASVRRSTCNRTLPSSIKR